MKNLNLTSTSKTPEVNFSVEGNLNISGRSIPEDSHAFYSPLIEWMDEYITSPAPKTSITFKLEYFNTSSSKCILDIMKRIEKLCKEGKNVEIVWIFEEDDEDMIEAGEDYASIIRVPVKFVEIV